MQKYPYLSEEFDYTTVTYKVNKISFLTNPVHIKAKEPTLFYSLISLMKKAKEEVKIHTPYIICNEMMYEALKEVCTGQAKVSLMTNSPANNDNPFGASDYILNKGKILDTGINIYEYEGGISYHGKSITIDHNISIIGSFNMDLRSVYLSTEIMLVADSTDLNKQLKNYMNYYEEASVRVIDLERVEMPEGVKRQEFTEKKEILVKIITLFNRFRFLM
ncbi:MAG TPA: phospholipase D-like domain-containing protein, partial [Mobilitalea sp.]|nr:phospholipase D-like domain-containing protein [Mobilitalea sp.]